MRQEGHEAGNAGFGAAQESNSEDAEARYHFEVAEYQVSNERHWN